MFIGHYGISYAVKKADKEIPLWLLFTSVQLPDLIAFTLVLLGIEKASYTPSDNPFFTNQLNLPFSHSLAGAIIISCLVFFFFRMDGKKKWAWILGLCVLSHWFIDLIMHTKDLPLWFGSYNTGLGLWKYPYLAYALEIFLVLAGWLLIKRRNFFSWLLLFLMIAGFSGMVFSEEPDVMKNNAYLRTSLILVVNGLFIFLAFLSDRGLKTEKTNVTT